MKTLASFQAGLQDTEIDNFPLHEPGLGITQGEK